MDKRKLLSLIKRDEGLKLDYKEKLQLWLDSNKKELAKDICAIANSKGGRGYIIVGVEDKTKRIVGVDKSEIFKEEVVQQIVTSRCEPPIPISVDIEEIDGKIIEIITIYDGGQKPYQVREGGAFYIRRGSTTDVMRKQEIIASFEEGFDFIIETCPVIKSSIELLNMDIVSKYFESKGIYISIENKKFLMESAGITFVEKESGKEKCTFGGLLVFSDNNSISIPQNMIRVLNKLKNDKPKLKIIDGNLINIIDQVTDYLYGILPKNYPVYAVMEGIKNAVLYREYSSVNRGIDVIVGYNSILVISPGQMIEKNIKGQRVNYNRRNMWLYEKLLTLDDKKRFQNTGVGFKRMREAFKGADEKVKFINSKVDDSFKVIFPGVKLYTVKKDM